MGKRYLISEQQLKIIKHLDEISNELGEIDTDCSRLINVIETRQEVFSSTNNILLDVGFVRGLYSTSHLWKKKNGG